MILFPAIDIREGLAVRLKQGRKEDSIVFSTDPVALASEWRERGARWLHIVDLDGAFEGARANAPLVGEIVENCDIPVQVGGGIRTLEDARAYLDRGAARVIIGTLALEKPEEFRKVCETFPGKIGVSLDAENGRLKSRGWVADAGLTIADILPQIHDAGAAFIVYTDIARDGMQSGLNIDALTRLLEMTDVPVIAAGGVASIHDIEALLPLGAKGLQGAISGRALYEGTLDLGEAQAVFDQHASYGAI